MLEAAMMIELPEVATFPWPKCLELTLESRDKHSQVGILSVSTQQSSLSMLEKPWKSY